MKKQTFFNAIKNKKAYLVSGLFVFALAFLLTAVSVGKVFADDETTPSTTTDTTIVVPDTSTTATTTTDPLAALDTSTIATDTTTIVGSITTEPTATETTTLTAPEETPVVTPVVTSPVVVTPPALSTDTDDYHPGDTATIFGNFFQSLQNVVLKIFGSDRNDNNYTEETQNLTADALGAFTSAYSLDSIYRPFYDITASDTNGNILAQGFFRDSAIGTYDQCSNDLGIGYSSGDTGCRWVFGNLNSNNSTYQEGDSTVQRLWLEGYAPGTTHTVTFDYGTTKGGKHAYDFLTTWDASENWVTVADRCQDITGCTTASETTLAIPHDPNGSGQFESGTRNFTMRGGTITAISTPTIVSGTYAGDSDTAVTVTFTVNSTGSMCATSHNVTSCDISLWFGAHIAKSSEWTPFNGTTGAGNISGSPYHVALAQEDGTSVGSRDNQMAASAIIAGSTITVHKVTSNQDTSTQFNFTTTGTGYSNFSLTGGTQNQQNITGTGSFSVTESALSGWSNTALTCTATGTGSSATPNLANRSVAITIGSAGGAAIDCIYTNTLQQAHLTLVKTLTKDNGGTAAVTDWTLSASGATPISGATGSASVTNAAVNSGTYTLSENGGPTGYTGGTYSCVKNAGAPVSANSVTLAAGDNATCTINNNDNAPSLTLNKIVVNNNGGTASESAWTLTATGPTTIFGPGASGSADVVSGPTFSAGTYALSESAGPSGYAPSAWTCTGGTQNGSSITLALGQTVSCSITNDDIGPTLKLTKTVTNDNGGTNVPHDWTLTATGTNGFSDAGDSTTFHAVNAGVGYSLSESTIAGYTAGAWNCTAGTLNGSTVTLSLGQNATCTINNNDNAAHLIVIKTVINDNGGSKVAGDFSGTISGVTANGGNTWTGTVTPGMDKTLSTVGSYSVAENADTGYDTTYSADCTGTIALGQTKTCTVTNNDKPAHLIVIKHVVNDNGGTTLASGFSTTISGVTTGTPSAAGAEAPGVNNTLTTVGSYSVDEGAHVGYDKTLSTDCSGTIALGETKTCTITNDDQAAHLIVIKHVVNDNGGTKTSSDFTMTIGGVTATGGNSFAGAENPGTNKTLSTLGAYTVTEGAVAGYAQASASTDCSGTIALGETKTCTITNDDIKPLLTLTKIVVNDNGGNAVVSDFPLFVNTTGVISGVQNGFDAGSYTASETNMTGYTAGSWTGDCAVNGSITLLPGDVKACTITNDDQPAHIILNKVVVNNNGGTAGINDFGLTVGGNAVSSGVNSSVNSNTPLALNEAGLTGYDFVSLTGDAKCPSVLGGSVTLNEGETVTCTITNDDQPAHLTVIKHVINDNGGTKVAGDFTMNVTGTNVSSPSFAGAENPGITVTLNAGSYSADEGAMTGYAKTIGANCSGTIALGESKTCTITNDDIAPTLKLVKTVTNDNGGTAVTTDFQGKIDNNNVPWTIVQTLSAGAHTASETNLPGYTAGNWGGDCATDGTITLSVGDAKTCTITNDDQPAHIIVIKHVVNDNGGTKTASDFTMHITGTAGTANFAGAENPGVNTQVNAGTYNVTEGALTGYTGTMSGDCSGSIANGETKTCTITNDDQPAHLTVIKHVINHGGSAVAGDFTMNVAGTNVSSPSFAGAEAGTTVTLNAGSYSADESLNSNYTKTIGANCSGTIANGETKTCTITNEEKTAKLTIVKVADPKDLIDFSFNGTGGIGAFSLDDDAGVSGEDNTLSNTASFTNKNTGNYTVTETEPNSFWTLSSASCVNTANSTSYSSTLAGTALTVNLTPGSDVTCTFHNHKDSPTRTQGFWQTHTAFTSTKFTAGFPAGMQIGSGLHKGIITNTQSNGQSQLFGAYYSNIAKTTTNAQRTAVDKARMQLLQQLVTAKLNCATFTCSATIAGQIAAADTAYATGTAAQIIAAAGQMDAYNNSGDTIVVGNAGSASPKTSQAFANMVLWNLP